MRLGDLVTGIDEEAVWGAGVAALPLVQTLGAPLERGGGCPSRPS
ncbi:MAG: hypothetical protein V3T81_07375 [Thermoanaerobaculia bacterium]